MKRLMVGCALACLGSGVLPAAAQSSAVGSGWQRWQQRVAQTQAEQPHWITPLITVTPRLEQEFRFDALWRQLADGIWTAAYGGKGLELIPCRRCEVIVVAPPAYLVHSGSPQRDGWGDWGFLVKYRLLAANEQRGNYVVTFFLAATVPTGSPGNGLPASTLTPTLAYGKGFGRWDLQGTLGLLVPTSHTAQIGRTLAWNQAVQYHARKHLWPELEVNLSHFLAGPQEGRTQVFLTPGIVLGRYELHGRLGITVGTGVQFAVSSFHTSQRNYVLTVRVPF